jgi:hypothetical protein
MDTDSKNSVENPAESATGPIRETIVNPRLPHFVNGELVPALEVLYRGSTIRPKRSDLLTWNGLLRAAASGNGKARTLLEREANRDRRPNSYAFRLFLVLLWLEANRQVDAAKLVLVGEENGQPTKQDIEAALKKELGYSPRQRKHPLAGYLDHFADPVMRAELLDRMQPEPVEHSMTSMETLYPTVKANPAQAAYDEFTRPDRHDLRPARHPDPEPPKFAPEPGKEGNEL